MRIEVTDKDTAEEIIEQGIGLVARGLFRMAATAGPDAAAREAQTVISHIREHWFDLERQAAAKKKEKA